MAEITRAARSTLLRCVAIPDDQLQAAAILRSDSDDDTCSLIERLSKTLHSGTPSNASTILG